MISWVIPLGGDPYPPLYSRGGEQVYMEVLVRYMP
jgi:hypothetical protein